MFHNFLRADKFDGRSTTMIEMQKLTITFSQFITFRNTVSVALPSLVLMHIQAILFKDSKSQELGIGISQVD
jgi:hypothetical protein